MRERERERKVKRGDREKVVRGRGRRKNNKKTEGIQFFSSD